MQVFKKADVLNNGAGIKLKKFELTLKGEQDSKTLGLRL